MIPCNDVRCDGPVLIPCVACPSFYYIQYSTAIPGERRNEMMSSTGKQGTEEKDLAKSKNFKLVITM